MLAKMELFIRLSSDKWQIIEIQYYSQIGLNFEI